MGRKQNTPENFWKKVNKTPTCWEWMAGKDKDGYGVFSFRDKQLRANRVSWMLSYGDIPDGQKVLHTCDNPRCVNPEHLFLGTHLDNDQDKMNKGRQSKGESHGMAVLTEIDVRVVRKLVKEGFSQASIARALDCSVTAINRIVLRKTWKHIPETEETK